MTQKTIAQLRPEEVKRLMADNRCVKLLDVREVFEQSLASIRGAQLLDAALVEEILARWPKDTPMVCHCHHGMRSQQACEFFRSQGFTRLYNMAGGIDAWSVDVDPEVERY